MADALQQTEAQRQQALESNKKAREAREKQAKEAEALVKETQAERERTNAETMERQNKSKPTPTQEESDLAAAGIHTETHEYDGSPPQGVTPEDAAASAKYYKQDEESAYVGGIKHRKLEAKPGGPGYATRQAKPA